jgi:integrase
MPVIASLLGHADTRMTEKHYGHLSPSYVAQMLRANLPSFGFETIEIRNDAPLAG